MGQELYFERDDKLGRKRYAEFLKNLILNSSAFKREDERKAFSIAIDSPWGTGKSYFLNMLKNHLRGLSSDESAFDPNGPFRVVLYNAWENDCWNNAFEPLAQKLCESSDIGDLLPENKDALKEAVKSIRIVLQGMGEKAVENMISDNAINELKQRAANVYDPYLNVSEEYVKFRQSVDMLKYILSEAAQELQARSKNPCAKLVIIIDELDRCRPDFAVQTMEFVKHLFDAENVAFLFALDMSQLCHSVKSIYGEGMDAEGYLIRFFDYYGKLLQPALTEFIQQEIGNVPHLNNIVGHIAQAASQLEMSLRDIKTVIRVFLQMETCFLKNYKSNRAQLFYFKLVCLKYKFPNHLKAILSGDIDREPIATVFSTMQKVIFKLNEPIHSTNEKKLCDEVGHTIGEIRGIDPNVQGQGRGTFSCFCFYREFDSISLREVYATDSINEIFFQPDLKKWDQIKDLTPAQYLMQQLEMFDFFQPNNQ